MTQRLFTNARIIDPASGFEGPGGVLVEDGVIREVLDADADAPSPRVTDTIDCHGHVLAPGLIDMRSFRVDADAANAGGITSVALMPDQSPPLDEPAMIAHMADAAARRMPLRVFPVGAASKGLIGDAMAEIGLMSKAGAVAISDGSRAIAKSDFMRRLLEYSQAFDLAVIQHAEDPALAMLGDMNEGETATRLGLNGIPTVAETIMVERDIRLLEAIGGRLHIAQISLTDSLAAAQRAKANGHNLSLGTSPQYFILNENAVGDYRTYAKVSPPLRSEQDRASLIEAIRAGLIDVICSGHEPRDPDSKRLPFEEAAFGLVGYETLLPLSLSLHHAYDVPLIKVLEMLTSKPAQILGLDTGVLANGAPADFVIFDPDKPWRIDPARFRSETQNSPFEGQPVQGKVLMTVLAGQIVFQDQS